MTILKSMNLSVLIKTNKALVLSYLMLGSFIGAIYLPLILQGGIIVDDWGDIHPTLSCKTFYECYRSWFPLFSNRPLAPLSITSTTMLFGTNFHYYLLLNSSIYLLALVITSRVIQPILGSYPALIFLFFSCIPIIALPIIVSPINQSTATFALLYWALSIFYIKKFCQTNSKLFYFLSYTWLLCGFLTYEVILPLLALTASLPIIFSKINTTYSAKTYFARFILPILVILGLVVIWQKGFAPKFFGIDYSRLALSPNSIYASIYSWIGVFTNQIPNLFIKIKFYLEPSILIVGAPLIIGIGLACYFENLPQTQMRSRVRFFYAGLFCLLSTSLIFILSGTTAESAGYQARGLSSTWISLSIFISSIAGLIYVKIWRISYLIVVLIFGFLSTVSFTIQRDGYIDSWRLQNQILDNVVELSKKSHVPKNATIIGVVPQFVPRNYNDEIVFSQPWDFGSALSIVTKDHITSGYPIDPDYSQLKGLYVNENGVKGTNWGGADWKNLWLYRYNLKQKIGSMIRIQSENDLKAGLVSLGYLEDFNGQSLVRIGQPILFSQKIVNGEKFIKEGWSSQERWGRWSNGHHSQLILPLPTEDALTLNISANAFITDAHPSLGFKVSINGSQEQSYSISKVENNFISIPIPTTAKSHPYLTVDFDFINPKSPKDLGIGSDERKLGIGITAISFAK